MRRHRTEEEELEELAEADQSLHHFKCPSRVAIATAHCSGKPPSAVLLRDGSIGCVMGTRNMIRLLPTAAQDDEKLVIMTLECNTWILEECESEFFNSDIVGSLPLLPMLKPPRTTGVHCCINSRWQECRNGTFQLPEHVQMKETENREEEFVLIAL
jgi:hypothetical protein